MKLFEENSIFAIYDHKTIFYFRLSPQLLKILNLLKKSLEKVPLKITEMRDQKLHLRHQQQIEILFLVL